MQCVIDLKTIVGIGIVIQCLQKSGNIQRCLHVATGHLVGRYAGCGRYRRADGYVADEKFDGLTFDIPECPIAISYPIVISRFVAQPANRAI
jgi:hypothetical protein